MHDVFKRSWEGTPYKKNAGANSTKEDGSDCSGATWSIFKDSKKAYEYRAANSSFEESLEPGKANEGKFRKLKASERPIIGDIGIWMGFHMVIHSGYESGEASIITTSSRKQKVVEMPLQYMVKDFHDNYKSAPDVVWFRPRF